MSALQRALRALVIGAVILCACPALPAQTTQPSGENSAVEQAYNPIPQRLIWPGIAVIVLIAIFATAALAGPLIRANHDDEDEPASDKNPD